MSRVIRVKRVAGKLKRKGLQEASETSNVVWFGDSGTNKNICGRTRGVRVKDFENVFRSDEDGKD